MTLKRQITSIVSTLLVAGLCSMPKLHAQQQSNAPATQQPTEAQQPANPQPIPASPLPGNTQATPSSEQPQTQPKPNQSGTTVNPSQAPLQPVTTYPDATGAQQQEQPSTTQPAQSTLPESPQPKNRPIEPVGAAAAEGVSTAGGAAAKPAGAAIAPAKQHQTRSLLIKIGAAVAAGAALGTVFALSHSTSSLPPGTGMPGVTGR